MNVWATILTAIISTSVGAVVTAIVGNFKSGHAKNKAMQSGLQSLLRAEIIRQHEKYTDRGYCPIYAKDALRREYESYHLLGGNGVITDLYNDLIALPELPPHPDNENKTTLGAWVLAKVKSLINTKIKNEKARNLLQGATNVVSNAVKATYQTYVESIKGTDAWTKDAQEEALKLAIAAARMQLSADVEKFINDNFGDVETWIKSQIEATLYDLKNKPLEVQNENG